MQFMNKKTIYIFTSIGCFFIEYDCKSCNFTYILSAKIPIFLLIIQNIQNTKNLFGKMQYSYKFSNSVLYI